MLHLRTALVTALAVMSGLATAHGSDRYLTIALEGSMEPTNLDLHQEFTDYTGTTTITDTSDSITRSMRLGVIGLVRAMPASPVCPTFGVSLGRAMMDSSASQITSKTELLTGQVLGGLSFIPDEHVLFDVLAFTGFGRGKTESNGPAFVYNPDSSMREYGVRANLVFISKRGLTLMLFGGFKKMTLEEDGTYRTIIGDSSLSQSTRYQGGFFGANLGMSF